MPRQGSKALPVYSNTAYSVAKVSVLRSLVIWCSRAKGATYLVLPGRSATSWKFFFVAYVHVHTAYFFKTTFFELHHHQQSSRGPGLSPVKDWRPLQHGCVQLRSRVPAYLCDSCPPDWASSWRRGSDATWVISSELALFHTFLALAWQNRNFD